MSRLSSQYFGDPVRCSARRAILLAAVLSLAFSVEAGVGGELTDAVDSDPVAGNTGTQDTPSQAAIAVRMLGPNQGLRSWPVGLDAHFALEVVNLGPVDLNKVRVSAPAVPECELAIGHLPVGESVAYLCAESSGKSGTLTHREYVDRFERADFDNRDGVDAWASAWQEVDHQGAGPAAGSVAIADGRLRLIADAVGAGASVSRAVDLRGMETAAVRIDWRSPEQAPQSGEVVLEISRDGRTFFQLDRFPGANEAPAGSRTYDVTPWVSRPAAIRLRALGGTGRVVDIDSIEITAQGWMGGEDYTHRVTVIGEDPAGNLVSASAQTRVEFGVRADDAGAPLTETVWVDGTPANRRYSRTPL